MFEDISLRERLTTPVPEFFSKVRKVSLTLGAIGTALLTLDMELPVWLVSIAGYMITAGAVATAISSATVDTNELAKKRSMRKFRRR
jgi:hypothetical protein